MGLFIQAFKNIQQEADPDDGLSVSSNGFDVQFEGLVEGYYSGEQSHDTLSFTYDGYMQFRELLASLVYPPIKVTIEDEADQLFCDTYPHFVAVNQHTTGPFVELINFTDSDGTIGSKCAQKLYDDFIKYDKTAKQKMGDQYENYAIFTRLFEYASNNGFVMFG